MSVIAIMSERLQLSIDHIDKIAKEASKHYKFFQIPKANGTKRNIYHPSQQLKVLQYWLTHYIFQHLPVSDFSTAYSKGCSIKANALRHIHGKHYLHTDLKNFFESINRKHLEILFKTHRDLLLTKNIELNAEDIDIICNICLRNGQLTIGSVCAPALSNCVMNLFDIQLRAKLSHDIVYTRYADDLIFSSVNYIPIETIRIVEEIATEYGFCMNADKTMFMSQKGRRTITGLIVDQQRVSIGLHKRRFIKSLVYNKIVKGIGDSSKILGHLFYLKDIEPAYFNQLVLKYSKYGNVMEILKRGSK